MPLKISPLLHEGVHLVVSADHPFAARAAVRLEDLASEPFVHLDPANGFAGWLDAVAAGAGVVLQPVVRVRTSTTVAALAASGLGVGLVPDNTRQGPDVRAVPLDPPLSRQVVAMHHDPAQPLVEAFCAVLRDHPLPTSGSVTE